LDEVSGSEALAAGCDAAKYSETIRSAKGIDSPESMAYAQRLPPTRMMTLLMSVQEASSFVNRSTPPATATKTCPTNLNVTALAADAVEQLFYSVRESLLSVDRNVPTPCPVMERAPRRGGHWYRSPVRLSRGMLDLCQQVSGCRRCPSTCKPPSSQPAVTAKIRPLN